MKESTSQTRRFPFLLSFCLFFALIVSMVCSVIFGPVHVPFKDVVNILFVQMFTGQHEQMTATDHIIWSLRLPRTILAAVTGAGLAVVGVAVQALVRNPLADPYILGISSGASVGATLVLLMGVFSFLGTYALSTAAFLGALLAVAIVYSLAREGNRLSVYRLLLSGVAISMVLSAVTSFLVLTNPREEGIRSALFWMLGSFSGANLSNIVIPSIVVGIGMVLLFQWSVSLNVFTSEESTARSLGLHTSRFQMYLILLTSLMTGVLVAVSGAIGFVGLMVPHAARLLIGANHSVLIPISAMLGASFMVWADLASRLVIAPEELPVGIITAICGGPFFIWLLRKKDAGQTV